jgi:hypothetical protein
VKLIAPYVGELKAVDARIIGLPAFLGCAVNHFLLER